MPELLPFAGLRPDPAITGPLDDVVCPPYDVISEQERLSYIERSPFNVVRVELPLGRYEEAARLLAKWTTTGALRREEAPALYGYRMTYEAPDGTERQTLGALGALVLEQPGHGILPHERTTPKAKTDRLELIRAVHANTSPIWCLSPRPGLTAVLESSAGAPGAAARDDDGVLHEIWPIFDLAAHQQVADLTGPAPLLVADGHHRYEVALAHQAEARARVGNARPSGPDCVLAFVVELAEEQLQVLPIHRLLSGLPLGFDALEALRRSFQLRPASATGAQLLAEMARVGALAALTADGAWLAVPLGGEAGPSAGPLGLDSSRADASLTGWPPHVLDYETDTGAIAQALRSGQADLALLCRPASIDQIARTARGQERMPPKTTFFWPKPRTGMVLRDFSG